MAKAKSQTQQVIQENKVDQKLEQELKKLGNAKIFVESEETPDDFKQYPLIVVCKDSPKEYSYPLLMKLETSNLVRLTAMNNHLATCLRIVDMLSWCLDIRLKRKRQINHAKTGKILIVNEIVLEKIPACRR